MLRVLFVLILSLTGWSAQANSAQPAVFCNTVLVTTVQAETEFVHKVELHRVRVMKLALVLARLLSTFAGQAIRLDSVESALALHDINKLDHETISVLISILGSDLSPELRQFVNNLHDRDAATLAKHFEEQAQLNFKLSPPKDDAEYLRRSIELIHETNVITEIEHAADLIDRGLDPGAKVEWGKSRKLASIYLFDISVRDYPTWWKDLIVEIEDNYSMIISLSLDDIRSGNYSLKEPIKH